MHQRARRQICGEIYLPRGAVIRFRAGALGQGAEAIRHRLDGSVRIDIAHDGDLDRCTVHQRLDHRFGFGEVAAQQGGLIGQTEARIVIGYDARYDQSGHALRLPHYLGQEDRHDIGPLRVRLGAVAGLGEIGGGQFHLQVQIVCRGGAAGYQRILANLHAEADILAGQDFLQIRLAVRFQTGRGPDGGNECVQPGFVTRKGKAAAIDAHIIAHAAFLEIRGLDVQAHIVGEGHFANAQIVDHGVGHHRARRAPILIGKGCRRALVRRADLGLFGGGVDIQHGLLIARQRLLARDADQRRAAVPQRIEAGVDRFQRQGRFGGFEQAEAIGRGGDEAVIVQGGQNGVGQTRAAAGIGLLRGGPEIGFHIGKLHVELRLREAILLGAAQFLFGSGQRRGPFAILGGECDAGAQSGVAQIIGAHAAAHDHAVRRAGDALYTPVECADCQRIDQAFDALRRGIRRVVPWAECADRCGIGHFRINEHFHRGRAVQIDRAEVQRRARFAHSLPIAEALCDLLLHRGDVKIADHHEGGVFRPVIALVQAFERGSGGIGEHLCRADRQAAGIGRIGSDEAERILGIAQPYAVAGAHFTHDDTAFAVHSGGIEQQIACRLAHQHHRGVDGFFIGLG